MYCCSARTNYIPLEGQKSYPKSSHPCPGVRRGCRPAVSQRLCKAGLQQNGFTTKMACLQAILLPIAQTSNEPKMNGKRLLETRGCPCRRWGSHPRWGSERWDCRFSWLWVELPADPGRHLHLNHGFPWKKTCPGETRQPAAYVDGFEVWNQKNRSWPQPFEAGSDSWL